MNNLKKKYFEEIMPAAKKDLKISSSLGVPRMEKVVLNIGTSQAQDDDRLLEVMTDTLTRISGQKPVATKARKSISNFKIRKGMNVGMSVTMRGDRMYDFAEKLIDITLPRIRDFRGLRPEAIDQQGNLNVGIREHNVFPEINIDEIERLHGLEVSVRMTGGEREASEYILRALGFPFAERGKLEKKASVDDELSNKGEANKEKE
ncbi:50S ribosomal protein L5 [Patescibacteria group bacterium]